MDADLHPLAIIRLPSGLSSPRRESPPEREVGVAATAAAATDRLETSGQEFFAKTSYA